MSVFRRRREDGPSVGSADPASASVPVARDPELGVPPFRPAAKEPPAATTAPRPTAAPVTPVGGPRPTAPVNAPRAPLPPRAEATERRTLVVGKGISLQGTVSDAERLVVEGTVESQMIQAAELHVYHSGVCKGELVVEDAEIAGTFDGTITASGTLIIRGTGKVLGVARYRRLQVEEGAQLSGRIEMITDASAPRPVPAPAPVALRSPEPAEA
jgi:cytoskeletal protein CcmA (bactofilin family)